MASIEELQHQIQALKAELAAEKLRNSSQTARHKIEQMSSEVVDSNPYR